MIRDIETKFTRLSDAEPRGTAGGTGLIHSAAWKWHSTTSLSGRSSAPKSSMNQNKSKPHLCRESVTGYRLRSRCERRVQGRNSSFIQKHHPACRLTLSRAGTKPGESRLCGGQRSLAPGCGKLGLIQSDRSVYRQAREKPCRNSKKRFCPASSSKEPPLALFGH